MSAWLIWGIIIVSLALIAIVKVGFCLEYREEKVEFRLLIGPFPIKFTQKKKDAPQKAKENNKKAPVEHKKGQKKWKMWVKAALSHWDEILTLVGRVLTAPTIDILKLYISVGGEPDECAVRYGQICAGVGALLAPLENTFAVLKRDVGVRCTFGSEKLKIDLETRVTLKIYEVIALLVAGLRLLLCLYREVNMNKKVVQKL